MMWANKMYLVALWRSPAKVLRASIAEVDYECNTLAEVDCAESSR
jgi:hypothetical protein